MSRVATNPWDERAQAYRESDAHREGPDLDLLVGWASEARTALDVGAGGGHVARRLRDAGLEVTTCDPSPAMEPDVVCAAEDLPFPDRSFDVVATRVAAHHFADLPVAVRELARVSRDLVLVVDNLSAGEAAEEADRLRDPSHVRNYSEAEWRELLGAAGLAVEDVAISDRPIAFQPWLDRVGCSGETATRVRELLADRIEGERVRLDRICIRARKEER